MESRNKEVSSLENIDEVNNNEDAAAENETAAFSHEEKPQKQGFIERIKNCKLFTTGFKILLVIFALGLIVYVTSRFIPEFAEFWTRYLAQWIRFILAKITGIVSFSVAEAVIVSLPVIGVAYIVASSVSTKRDESDVNFYRWFRPLLSLILVIVTIFLTGFGPAYGRNKLAVNLGLEQKDISVDELYETGKIVADFANNEIDEIVFDINGASVMPYDYSTLVDKMNAAFDKYAENEDYISHFSSKPKAIALSPIMTYTHISGVYTFMTGESNINTNYPDFLMPFTMAHEMAHQRGIAREDEANFVAFLVCIGSDDAYIRYSGYTNMLNYINSALSSASSELITDLYYNHIKIEIRKEFTAYSNFFDKYRDSVASDVSEAVNNTFLQSQGQTAGTKSYGLVVDLAVAYYK